MKRTFKTTASILLLLGLVAGCESSSHPQSKLQAEAKITEADARATALARIPNGAIKESELEREKGHLQWSFDVTVPGQKDTTEVNVDAITGQVIGVSKESAGN